MEGEKHRRAQRSNPLPVLPPTPPQGLLVKEKGHPHALKLQKTSSEERKTGGTWRFLRSSLGVLSIFYA